MDQLKVHSILNQEDQNFAEFWKIYSDSFPIIERRTLAQQTALFNKSGYQLKDYTTDNHFIGFISYWKTKEFIFIEHLAISPEFRSKGLGNAVLKSFNKNTIKPIILEIELPSDTNTRRRLHFYESLGYKSNDHNHCQPPYHKGDEPIPMKILSFPAVIGTSDYQQFARFQKEVVMV